MTMHSISSPISPEHSWKGWKDTKLAELKDSSGKKYTVENCLACILPEKIAPAAYTAADRQWLIDLIQLRFEQRFIRPLDRLIKPHASPQSHEYVAVGFTIMAISSLMIETLACFRNGQWATHKKTPQDDPKWIGRHGWRKGKESFKHFLENTSNCFNSHETLFAPDEGVEFYENIRCGILHQAETKGEWRVFKNVGPAVSRNPNVINAVKFLKILKDELKRYTEDLKDETNVHNVDLWKAARYKILGICASAGWDRQWPMGGIRTPVNWNLYW